MGVGEHCPQYEEIGSHLAANLFFSFTILLFCLDFSPFWSYFPDGL
jgi:hypothetical protein